MWYSVTSSSLLFFATIQVLLQPCARTFASSLEGPLNCAWVLIPCAVVLKEVLCIHIYQISSVQLLRHVRLFATPWTAAHQAVSMCRVFSCVVGRGCLLWPVSSLGKTLLAFSLLDFVRQAQTCLLLQVSLDFLLCFPVPYDEKDNFFGVTSRKSYGSS